MSAVDRMLEDRTGKGARHWMNRIGQLIGECARPIPGHPGLSTCDPWVWVGRLALELTPAVLQRCPAGADENIAVGNVLGALLALWCQRIMRAKAHDPRRPVQQRRDGLQRKEDWAQVLLACVSDASQDHLFFPAQQWDDPNLPGARYEPDAVEKKRQRFASNSRKARRKK